MTTKPTFELEFFLLRERRELNRRISGNFYRDCKFLSIKKKPFTQIRNLMYDRSGKLYNLLLLMPFDPWRNYRNLLNFKYRRFTIVVDEQSIIPPKTCQYFDEINGTKKKTSSAFFRPSNLQFLFHPNCFPTNGIGKSLIEWLCSFNKRQSKNIFLCLWIFEKEIKL